MLPLASWASGYSQFNRLLRAFPTIPGVAGLATPFSDTDSLDDPDTDTGSLEDPDGARGGLILVVMGTAGFGGAVLAGEAVGVKASPTRYEDDDDEGTWKGVLFRLF
mmetsp:Transcript_7331/g.7418  ORF Transcript_7331/g.7418 Transcript_7331/m.7418 type:complete len:107 (+) Transcript_7331:109-429(+)